MIRDIRFSEEFDKAFKRLKKKYKSLPDDFKKLGKKNERIFLQSDFHAGPFAAGKLGLFIQLALVRLEQDALDIHVFAKPQGGLLPVAAF